MQATQYCSTCELQGRCVWRDQRSGPVIEAHSRVYHADESIFEAGEPCTALHVVRSGVVKSISISPSGDEQVLGFHYPGSAVGCEGLADGVHITHAISVGTSSLCAIPCENLAGAAGDSPLVGSLLRVLGESAALGIRSQLHLGVPSAEQRIAAFLVQASRQYERQGYAPSELRLPMRRMDIARYLSLAIETVSRAFRKLEDAGLIVVDPHDRHRVTIPSLDALRERADAAPAELLYGTPAPTRIRRAG